MQTAKIILCAVAMVGIVLPVHALTQQELVAKLESAGYSQVREIKPTAKSTAVKAIKNGKEAPVVFGSSGQIREQRN
jgi:hypothetical protein